jgi:perosamine synthetase
VKECLDTGWVSSVGSYVDRFEAAVAARCDRAHAVATTSGTAALHVALLLAGVRPDDEVVVSTLTFAAPAFAIRYLGAWPLCIDAEPDYWQLDPARLEDFLARGCERRDGALHDRSTGRRVAAIVPVHILGHPVDVGAIIELAERYGLPVVEDAAESFTGRYRQRPIGSFGLLACLSFNGNKMLTSGGGGMVVTDDAQLAERARYLTTQAKDDPVEYVHGAVGFNYRLGNVQAALGCAQLEQADEFLAAKRRVAARYAAAFVGVDGLTPMPEAPWAESAFWLYTILIDPERFPLSSRELLAWLEERRIQSRPLWQPLHRSPALADAPLAECPVADRIFAQALSLPSSVGLSDGEQDRVIEAVLEAARR